MHRTPLTGPLRQPCSVTGPPTLPPTHTGLTAAVPSPAVHHFVELRVHTMLESDMAHAFLTDSNEGMTATDTQKNCVYYVAKQAGR